MTPYEVVYGQKPLSVTSYLLGTSKVHVVDNTLHTREAILHTLKDNLVMAQNRMKQQVDQHHSECSFAKGIRCFFTFNPINKHHSKIKSTRN
jgi:hypothetical protein